MVDKLTHERAQAEMLRDNYANESEQWHEKYDEELAQRKDLEADLNQMRKDCDDATLVRVDLERKIETMVEEMEFLKKIHADEVRSCSWPRSYGHDRRDPCSVREARCPEQVRGR